MRKKGGDESHRPFSAWKGSRDGLSARGDNTETRGMHNFQVAALIYGVAVFDESEDLMWIHEAKKFSVWQKLRCPLIVIGNMNVFVSG